MDDHTCGRFTQIHKCLFRLLSNCAKVAHKPERLYASGGLGGQRGGQEGLDIISRPDPAEFAVQHKCVVFVTSHPQIQGGLDTLFRQKPPTHCENITSVFSAIFYPPTYRGEGVILSKSPHRLYATRLYVVSPLFPHLLTNGGGACLRLSPVGPLTLSDY